MDQDKYVNELNQKEKEKKKACWSERERDRE